MGEPNVSPYLGSEGFELWQTGVCSQFIVYFPLSLVYFLLKFLLGALLQVFPPFLQVRYALVV